jgi:anti-anti-sigma factor
MEAIERKITEGVIIETINLLRATMQEAKEIKSNLLEDLIDHKKIIVDLSACNYVDSTFFGALVYSYRKIKEQQGTIILILNDTFLRRTFLFREIEKIFKVCRNCQEAISELNKCFEEIDYPNK